MAASAVATVQQFGLALGAAAVGLIANAAGMAAGVDLEPAGIARAAFWVPASFVAVAVIAAMMGGRLRFVAARRGIGDGD